MKENLSKKISAYFLLFLFLFLAALYFFVQARYHQQKFKSAVPDRIINETMPISFVIMKFNIPEHEILGALGLPANHWNERYTIKEACDKNKLDCAAVVDNLNSKIPR